MNNNSKLEDLFMFQKLFMSIVGMNIVDKSPSCVHANMTTAILGLASEVGEVAQAWNFNTRTWGIKDLETAKTEIELESIDVLFYLLELYISMFRDPKTIYDAYVSKLKRNLIRFLKAQDQDMVFEILKSAGVGYPKLPLFNDDRSHQWALDDPIKATIRFLAFLNVFTPEIMEELNRA